MRRLAQAVACFGITAAAAGHAAEPVRGVWLANVPGSALYNADAVAETVDRCEAAGINTIFVVTWNRGVTLYPSAVLEREFGVAVDPKVGDRDPLAELIEAAHAADIKVIAWFEFGFSCSYREPDGGRLLRARPRWAALTREGDLVSRNGFQWMNAFDPEVQDFLIAMLKEAVQRYDLDGVQGDDRLPALPNTGGYDPLTVELYRADHDGRSPPDDASDPDWTQWRADRLSRFVERAYRELKAVDPELCVSWSPSIYPWSKENYLQDWPRWAVEGWGDLFCPQVYRGDVEAYRRELRKIAEQQLPRALLPKVAPGILIALADGYEISDETIRGMVDSNREFGFEGEVFFYYDGLERHERLFETLYAD